jgi:hypothetical protein
MLTLDIRNPNWPPHARFHNGQTMSTGLALGLLTLYYTWRTPTLHGARDSIFTAGILGSLYFITAASAILYPGTLWIDPEFGEGSPQGLLFLCMFSLSWVGAGLELWRLKKAKID